MSCVKPKRSLPRDCLCAQPNATKSWPKHGDKRMEAPWKLEVLLYQATYMRPFNNSVQPTLRICDSLSQLYAIILEVLGGSGLELLFVQELEGKQIFQRRYEVIRLVCLQAVVIEVFSLVNIA
jgi:hypothetical protein